MGKGLCGLLSMGEGGWMVPCVGAYAGGGK